MRDLLRGEGKGQSYERLARFVDQSGSRFTGTDSLENAIDVMVEELEAEGFENVHTEDVTVSFMGVYIILLMHKSLNYADGLVPGSTDFR